MSYHRYHIPSEPCPHVAPYPDRFQVRVIRWRLARLLLRELIHYRFNLPVVTSRPCVYGTFSGPVGGFAPRPGQCVGCLRCTLEYPEMVRVRRNPARLLLGDSYFTPEKVDTVLQEAATGQIPVRGAGYRGAFGGEGWDGMWTDMSEIVRPTRDGIHGREFISTIVDLGERPGGLGLDEAGAPSAPLPRPLSLPIPLLFDAPPLLVEAPSLCRVLAEAASRLETLAILPLRRLLALGLPGTAVAPLLGPEEIEATTRLPEPPRMLELDGWDEGAYRKLRARFPAAAIYVRLPLERDLQPLVRAGIRLFHLTADYHGRAGGVFVGEAIRSTHAALVKEGIREEVVLLGSGGIIMAADVAKAVICGLDAVALDTAVLVALQGRLEGDCSEPTATRVALPRFDQAWGVQRLCNLAAAWRDQLLEILGAMGLREVRRLRGELGRAMLQADLEREAFAGIAGFEG
ncbi:MAG TPA: glutamate synthase-related protein [Candidatus Methylomirabilis sp.]|nr:glutamate synthase-related protein [Candidatus Methylomirabilis sp.]